ncbi:CASP8 and FADD-like apoptosis regulator isoform X1 [Syngnathus typhle]|uniref:CASP8 and FADD-like apoptosis regulator isoform X1 n=2 Tax=Syngnathus typhle TaxID=161592 RepID=UPI002A6B6B45|nr:CASP8 and FADD-like apoptosis regulator isoform X1 [Syngnathus typhle]
MCLEIPLVMTDTDSTTFKFPGLLYAYRPNPRNNPLPASMAVCETEVLLAIHQIAESLGNNERLKVFYLCETLDTDNSAARMKETLKSKVTSSARGRLFLVELMLHLRRYDILRQVFGYSKDEVERTFRSREVLPRFRVLMTHLSDDMESKDVSSLKFLLGNILPREKTNFLDLIVELEHQDKISPERVDFLEECLKQVGRVDLAKKLAVYKMSVNLPVPEEVVHHPCQSSVDRYTFTSNTRGVCLIIDCVGNDGEMLQHRFQSLHFNVTLHKWLGLVETVSALKGVFRGSQDYRGDSFVCCIISRGTGTHLLATDTQVEGLRFKDVRRLFTGNVCAALVGKPKLFFIQSYSVAAVETCAGENHNFQPYTRENQDDENLETDAGGGAMALDSMPATADVLWSHSWTSEQQLQGQHRSVYLRALTDSLGRNQERRRHVLDLHKDVNKAIFEHNRRHPDQEYHIDLKTTLRKELYL